MFYNHLFDKEWLNNYILNPSITNTNRLKKFILSNEQDLICPDLNEVDFNLYDEFLKLIEQKPIYLKTTLQIKEWAHHCIASFTKAYEAESEDELSYALDSDTRRKIAKAEKIMNDNLFLLFPGIEFLANKVGISPTKFKLDFKRIYGQSPYQYYSNKKLECAKTILVEKNVSVKNIAESLGYINVSKFIIAFKKKHGVLPSKIE